MSPSAMVVRICRKVSLALVFLAHATWPASSKTQATSGTRPQRSVGTASSLEHLRASAQALQNDWLVSTRSGTNTWKEINAWQRFTIVDALAQYMELSGDRSYLPQIEGAVANSDGLDGNDDDLWAVIASLHVYRINRSPALLNFSVATFSRLTSNYWDEACGGGMWWDHQRTYKNAITNELLLYAATMLHRATNDPVYSAWAHKEWTWFRNAGLIDHRNLVNDGLSAACKNNNGIPYTYNQGVILGGLVNLYEIEGDSSYIDVALSIAQAMVSHLNVAGILQESTPSLNQDGQAFKGIFVYYLGDLVPYARDSRVRDTLTHFLNQNADYVWSHRQKKDNKLNAYWDGNGVLYGAAAQAAGLDLLNAAFRLDAPPHQSSSLEAK